ncbi:hypothetical protein DT070_05575 [Polaromonas sp. SP1]|nr:hypothetical protein DT070_05575 [Polaromonas sp. SP1]QGJ17612.1 hypothetical protein F7R28_03870 [Polaromonas sp. Pch-P]
MSYAPTLFTSCNALPPEGAARLRSGKASPAAHAGLKSLVVVHIDAILFANSYFSASPKMPAALPQAILRATSAGKSPSQPR